MDSDRLFFAGPRSAQLRPQKVHFYGFPGGEIMKVSQIKLLLFLAAAGLSIPAHLSAQTTNAPEASTSIEEVLVTGRKRSESLTDVPVSISVFNETLLAEAGIATQDDLFAATPGLDYGNWNGTRTDNNPGVRGVQSELRASNQQKVASFIDGLPMNGNTGTLSFTGVDAVEVYRGPQSAAFGRSTFAGAVNYVTSDAAEEFEGKVSLKGTALGGQELGILLTGPLGENLGYRVSYVNGDDTGPDEWQTTEGVDQSRQETERFSAKLNFEFSDSAYGELQFSRLDALDMPGAAWVVDPTSCGTGSGVLLNNMGARPELPDGVWDCEVEAPTGGLPRNTALYDQFVAQYDTNIAAYTAAFGMADADLNGTVSLDEFLAQTDAAGATYEQLLQAYSVVPGWKSDVDRLQGELNFEIGDNLLQFMGMTVDETWHRWNDNDASDTLAVFGMGMLGPNTMTMAAVGNIEEFYTEVRWISPEDQRLRYTVSATYYDYENNLQTYNALGAQELGLTIQAGANAGDPVNPQTGITISELATNVGLGLNLNYDLTDRTTLSLEGRYQVDEVCGQDALGANVKACSETKSFAPRIGINTQLTDTMSVYGQFSIGSNPAGVNIAYQDPGNIQALAVANGSIPVPTGVGAVNENVQYDGVGGNPPPVVDYDENTFETFDEEQLTNIEVGVKGSFADGRGSYTAAAYFMVYEDIIGAENLDWNDDEAGAGGWNEGNWSIYEGERTWINQGDAEMYGIELTSDYVIDDTWQVGGYLTLSAADYTDYCSIQGPRYRLSVPGPFFFDLLTPDADGVLSTCAVADGNQLSQHSPFTANFNVSAQLPDAYGFSTNIRLDLRHKGKHYEDHMNLLERSAVTTMNLSANMRSENWTVRAFVNNLTDNDEPARVTGGRGFTDNANPTLAAAQTHTWQIVPTRPREIGLQVEYKF